MQRRSANPKQKVSTPSISGGSSTKFSRRKSTGTRTYRPILMLLGLFAVGAFLSWSFFPSQVVEMEHEAEVVGQRLAQKAISAEHQVEDWFQKSNNNNNGGAPKRTSADATARMLAQSSKWVDGEKALKKQLSVLEEEQKQNKNLGVPVLTRYLGEDFPAWVTPDMDEAEWRKKVDAKYKEMRKEEEEWIKQMQKIIEERERDIGVTTA